MYTYNIYMQRLRVKNAYFCVLLRIVVKDTCDCRATNER
jgi:hypothetical protein